LRRIASLRALASPLLIDSAALRISVLRSQAPMLGIVASSSRPRMVIVTISSISEKPAATGPLATRPGFSIRCP